MNKSAFFWIAVMVLPFAHTQAQDKEIEKEFNLIQAVYKKNEYLSYTIQYLYAKEQTPQNYIDTVNGEFRINKNKFWGRLDNVEFVQDDSLFLSLCTEDKVIFLNNAAPDWMNVKSNWDSIWKSRKEKMKLSMIQLGDLTKIEMLYSGDSTIKKTELWYHSKNHLLQKLVYVVKQPYGMATDDEEYEEDKEDDFAVIEVRLSNYNFNVFDVSAISTKSYLQRNGKDFLPAQKYQDFKIYIGSPNLVN